MTAVSGYFTIGQKPTRAAGAMTVLAAIATACAARAIASKKPLELNRLNPVNRNDSYGNPLTRAALCQGE